MEFCNQFYSVRVVEQRRSAVGHSCVPFLPASKRFSYQSLGIIHSLVCAASDALHADMTLAWSQYACGIRSKASFLVSQRQLSPICLHFNTLFISGTPASASLRRPVCIFYAPFFVGAADSEQVWQRVAEERCPCVFVETFSCVKLTAKTLSKSNAISAHEMVYC